MVELTIERILWLITIIAITTTVIIANFTPYLQRLLVTHRSQIRAIHAIYNTTTNKIEIYIDIANLGNIPIQKVTIKIDTTTATLAGTPIDPDKTAVLNTTLPPNWQPGTKLGAEIIITYSDEYTETKETEVVIERT